MPDALFAHPRLARVYDAFDADRGDLAAYVALAEEVGARLVLDVGCGTGSLAVLLARRGIAVVGVDPAAASLQVARAKDGAAGVTWIHGDATAAPASPGADLATMTGNVAQVFLTDADWARALGAVHAALRPGGRLVLETRRPADRAWLRWAEDTEPVTLDVPGVGPVERHQAVTDVALPFVSFRYTYRFLADGEVVTSDSTLRFRELEEVASGLVDAGLRVLDVREAPDRPGREFVVLAGRPAEAATERWPARRMTISTREFPERLSGVSAASPSVRCGRESLSRRASRCRGTATGSRCAPVAGRWWPKCSGVLTKPSTRISVGGRNDATSC